MFSAIKEAQRGPGGVDIQMPPLLRKIFVYVSLSEEIFLDALH
jgi:hypothetical protein